MYFFGGKQEVLIHVNGITRTSFEAGWWLALCGSMLLMCVVSVLM